MPSAVSSLFTITKKDSAKEIVFKVIQSVPEHLRGKPEVEDPSSHLDQLHVSPLDLPKVTCTRVQGTDDGEDVIQCCHELYELFK